MSNEATRKQGQALEGEGSYDATRRYNEHLAKAIYGGELEAGAEEARAAMEGPERELLERAAAAAKRGPITASKPARSREADPSKPKG